MGNNYVEWKECGDVEILESSLLFKCRKCGKAFDKSGGYYDVIHYNENKPGDTFFVCEDCFSI